jgi:transcriptional regulator with XRE-family HTH domain
METVFNEKRVREDLRGLLAEAGWSQSRLSKESGVSQGCISRFLSDEEAGMNYRSFQRLWPYIYGEKRPAPAEPGASEEAAL